MNRISNSAIFFFANKFQIWKQTIHVVWVDWELLQCWSIGNGRSEGSILTVSVLVLYRDPPLLLIIQKTKVPLPEQIVKNKIFCKDNSGHFPPSLAGYDLWCVKSPGLFQSVWVSTVLQEHLTFLFQQNWQSFITTISFLRNDRKMLSQSWPEIKKRYWLLGFLP